MAGAGRFSAKGTIKREGPKLNLAKEMVIRMFLVYVRSTMQEINTDIILHSFSNLQL